MKKDNLLSTLLLSAFFLMLMSLRLDYSIFLWLSAIIIFWVIIISNWTKFVSRNVKSYIHFQPSRLFPNEEVSGELVIENRGILPVFGLMISFSLWRDLNLISPFFKGEQEGVTQWGRYTGQFNIGSKQTLRIPFKIIATKRGVFRFQDSYMEITDPFGYEILKQEIDLNQNMIIVYPSEVILKGLEVVQRMPQGDFLVRRWIQDDPFYPRGSRPYQLGDPFTRIDFKTTAKLQSLHTKTFDYTAHSDLSIVSNLLTNPIKWFGIEEDVLERNISIIARLARESIHNGMRFSLFINARMSRGLSNYEYHSGEGRAHYRKVMESLARFSFFNIASFPQTLAQVKQRFPNGNLLVLITAYINEEIKDELYRMSTMGFEIYIVNPNNENPILEKWIPFDEIEVISYV